jgi:hypothetical protein
MPPAPSDAPAFLNPDDEDELDDDVLLQAMDEAPATVRNTTPRVIHAGGCVTAAPQCSVDGRDERVWLQISLCRALCFSDCAPVPTIPIPP